MGGRFLKRLQQRVERTGRQHVNFVDDVDLITGRSRAVMDRVDDLTDIVDRGVRGRVHLHHVDVATFHNGAAGFALTARVRRRPAVSVRTDTVHALGNDPRGGGFAGATNARHHKGLRDAIRLERVLQGTHHRILSDKVGKGLGAVFAGQNLILGRVRHALSFMLALT